jgi:hypothetical protein
MILDPPAVIPRSRFVQFFVHYNPFYLLSAMCMLFGIFAMNNSLLWSPIPLHNLLTMIVMLNIYEGMLIALAIVLLRRNVRRDAIILLVIEAFFLVDVGFLNMEVFSEHLGIGLVVNSAVFAAGAVKVLLVFRTAKVPLGDGRFAFVLLQMGMLFAMPGIFAMIAKPRNTFLPPLALYGGWWAAGLLPVAYMVIVGSFDVFRRPVEGRTIGIDGIFSRLLLVLPLLSIVAHLSLSHWIYKSLFHPADLAPLLLGCAVAIGRADQHVASLTWRMRMQMTLPFVAVALSAIKFPPEMVFYSAHPISPLRMALLGSMLVYLDAAWLHRHVLFALAAGVCASGLFLGHNVVSINKNSVEMAQQSATVLDRLVPKTLFDWGVVSVGAAFVLLGLGAILSLMRREEVIVDAVSAEGEGVEPTTGR